MKKRKTENGKRKTLRGKIIICCLVITAYCLLSACSQPVLESSECLASRDSVKRFYSFHFGNEMKPSAENLKERREYLSQELIEKLNTQTETVKDYFTQTSDYPKAFRVGKCETVNQEKTHFGILLFWRTKEKNIQREITVDAVKENDKWLIDKVLPKK